MPTQTSEKLWTDNEAAVWLRVHPVTLRVWRHDQRPDQPPYMRVGRSIRYSPTELARWAERSTSRPGETTKKSHGPGGRKRQPGPR